MKDKLTEAEKVELLRNIQAVFDTGQPWKDDALHHRAGAIIDFVLSIKGVKKKATEESDEGFDVNGWQWDWWQHFEHDGKEYVLSGSGYYGGHAFHVAD